MHKAVESFQDGLKVQGLVDMEKILSFDLSRPYHILGNLAEAYYLLGLTDSSIFYSRIGLELALQEPDFRAISMANIQLGDAFLKQNQLESAEYYFKTASQNSHLKILKI